MRGTYPPKPYRKDCFGSDKAYSFNMTYGNPATLHIFESPIDCMSHASLENLREQNPDAYLRSDRLSLGGVSGKALEGYLKQFPSVKEMVFCLDNDDSGRVNGIQLAEDYAKKGYQTRLEFPDLKDYNEVLVAELTLISQGKKD